MKQVSCLGDGEEYSDCVQERIACTDVTITLLQHLHTPWLIPMLCQCTLLQLHIQDTELFFIVIYQMKRQVQRRGMDRERSKVQG